MTANTTGATGRSIRPSLRSDPIRGGKSPGKNTNTVPNGVHFSVGYGIFVYSAVSGTSVSGVYDIRELLRLATAKLESPGAPKADDTGAAEKDGAADDAERASAQTDIPTDGEPSGEPSGDPDISEPTAPADEPTAPADEQTAPVDEPTAPADEPTASTDEPTALRAVAAPVKRSQRSIRTHKRRRKARAVYDL